MVDLFQTAGSSPPSASKRNAAPASLSAPRQRSGSPSWPALADEGEEPAAERVELKEPEVRAYAQSETAVSAYTSADD